MKKMTLFILGLALSLGATAQTQVVKDAEDAMKKGEPFATVEKIITPALTNPETAQQAKTWYVPGAAAFKQYDKMLGMKQFKQLKTAKDSIEMDLLLIPAYNYFVKALPLDSLPNEKGKVKPKYSKDIYGTLAGHYGDFTSAGAELYNAKNFKGAYNLWAIVVELSENPNMTKLFKERGITADSTFVGEIAYNQALAAWQLENFDDALEAFMTSLKYGNNKKTVYDCALSVAASAGKNDTLVAIAREALPLYGQEDPNYIAQIVNYYLQKKDFENGFDAINKAIALDPTKSQNYVIHGVLNEQSGKMEEAMADYKKAFELDAENAQALYYYGHLLCEKAYKLNDESPTNDEEYVAYFNEKIKPLFLEAVEVLERSYSIDPDNRDVLLYLENAYYNLKDQQNYDDVQKRKQY